MGCHLQRFWNSFNCGSWPGEASGLWVTFLGHGLTNGEDGSRLPGQGGLLLPVALGMRLVRWLVRGMESFFFTSRPKALVCSWFYPHSYHQIHPESCLFFLSTLWLPFNLPFSQFLPWWKMTVKSYIWICAVHDSIGNYGVIFSKGHEKKGGDLASVM